MDNWDIELKKCSLTAKQGYDIAIKKQKDLNTVLAKAKIKIQETSSKLKVGKLNSKDTETILHKQLDSIQKEFTDISLNTAKEISELKNQMNKFTITLFGITMAGKSTLMEVLTNGNGDSIGKGAQRTTRDIRKYTWNNLDVIDVPGIGAFNGEEDENLAFESAKKGDLIIFLITDNAPQPIEAEWLCKVIDLGKPVICVMNVKTSFRENASEKMILRDISKGMNAQRIYEIRKQFLTYSEKIGQEWRHIPFVYVNLKAAYYCQNCDKSEDFLKQVKDLSNIEILKKMIINEVKYKGKLYRIKTFVDIITNPMIKTYETLLKQSYQNSTQGKVIISKKENLSKWMIKYNNESSKDLEMFITSLKNKLIDEIPKFVEDNFSNKKADFEWNRIVKSYLLDDKCNTFLKSIDTSCIEKINELVREIENELKFTNSFHKGKTITVKRIIDGKRIFDWTTTLIDGGLAIGSAVALYFGLACAGPLVWCALGVTAFKIIGDFFLKNRDKKEIEAKEKLRKSLEKNVDDIFNNIERQLSKNINKIISSRLNTVLSSLSELTSMIFELADTQYKLAWDINEKLIETNKQMLCECFEIIEISDVSSHIESVARIPGNTVWITTKDFYRIDAEVKDKLRKYTQELVYDSPAYENKVKLMSIILGKNVSYNDINVDRKLGRAYVNCPEISGKLITRIRLSQQLCELMILRR